MLTGRTIGLTALALLALGAGGLFAVAVPQAIDGIVPPQPMPVDREMRREFVLQRGMQTCIEIGGRAMHNASGSFVGCDRVPETDVQARAGNANARTRVSSSAR